MYAVTNAVAKADGA